jgi:16S rRNA (cytosine967-C5)-methyltransferase
MKPNERLQAVTILTKLLIDKIPLTHLFISTPTLSPFSKELCFGVCRQYYRLEAIADLLMTKRPKSTEIWVSLLTGLYQLYFLNIPDYAVVKETVELLPQLKATWAKGLINAVLRRYCREKELLLSKLTNHSLFKYGHSEWFINRLKKDWPSEWAHICLSLDEHPPMSLRVNAQKTSRIDYLEQLKEANINATPLSFSPQGIKLVTPCQVYDLPGFVEGTISVQDEAAQLAVSLLDLRPKLNVLDACCAPGGKTCHILETQADLNKCIALDVDKYRLKRVKENLDRLNLKATIIQGDALNPSDWWDGEPFERILLDAPCSATGIIRRHPDIKLLRTQNEITSIASLQAELLNALWPLLSPGGLLVYATCSIMPAENELQIEQFLKQHEDSNTIQIQQSIGHKLNHGLQILPGENDMDGFYYCVIKKSP